MKLYLAAQYLRRHELRRYKNELEALGHEVTATWLVAPHPGVEDDGVTLTGDPGALAILAWMDYADIDHADLLVAFTDAPTCHVRGGYLQEIGYAQGRRKPVAIVGPRRTLANWHPSVRWFATWEECADWIGRAEEERDGSGNDEAGNPAPERLPGRHL